MISKAARRLARGGFIAVALVACSGAAAPAASGDLRPAQQLATVESGVRFRLGPFFLGSDWIAMTVIIENNRDAAAYVAATYRPGEHSVLDVTLSDTHHAACQAEENPAGITAIPGVAGTPAADTASMTELPAHGRINISLRFNDCHLSKTTPLALSGKFALSTTANTVEVTKVDFWGIEQRTTLR